MQTLFVVINVLDFSAWKTKKFDGVFEKLLKGLQVNYEKKCL